MAELTDSSQQAPAPFAMGYKTTGEDLPPIPASAAETSCWWGARLYGGAPEPYGYEAWNAD
jgi:hypothetical protein